MKSFESVLNWFYICFKSSVMGMNILIFHESVKVTYKHQCQLISRCKNCIKLVLFFSDDVKDLSQVRNEYEIVCSLGVGKKFHPSVDHMFTVLVSKGGPYLSLAISGIR